MRACGVWPWRPSVEVQQALLFLWRRVPVPKLWALLVLMVGVGLTEGFGVLMLMPLLGVLGGSGQVASGWMASVVVPLEWLGLEPSVVVMLGLFVVLVGVRSAVLFGRDALGAVLQAEVVDGLRQDCFAALLRVEWRWVCGQRQADHANLLLTELNRIGLGLHFGLGWMAAVATGVAWAMTALWLSWQMTLLALAGGTLLLAALSGQRRQAVRLGMSLGLANRELQGNVQDALQGIRLAKILGSEGRHLKLFVSTVQQLRQQQLSFTLGNQRIRSLTHFGGAFVLVVFLYLGLDHGALPMAELLILVLIFARLIPLLMNAQQQLHHCLHAWPALVETQTFLLECGLHAEPAPQEVSCPLPVLKGLSMERVTVSYAGREQAALDDVSLVLPVRTTTALMGASGSGKSTMADVLMGLLLPDDGVVKIDGEVLSPLNRMRWRQSVAYVAQDVFLFQGTVRQNLLLASPKASQVDCVKALEMAAAEFVMSLPHGLDTLVGDGGVRLSGGERQRIALARALLGRPSLLILDEATSALDVENESRVRQALQALHGKVTTLVIGHRLPMLEDADQVVVLGQGHVRVRGTWRQIQDQLKFGGGV